MKKIITFQGKQYKHISTFKERRNTILQRLIRGKINDNRAIDPKTHREAIKLEQGWWIEID